MRKVNLKGNEKGFTLLEFISSYTSFCNNGGGYSYVHGNSFLNLCQLRICKKQLKILQLATWNTL